MSQEAKITLGLIAFATAMALYALHSAGAV
jgi:hypothetical protein